MGTETAFIPPNSRKAEEALLGSLLIDASYIIEISDVVKPEYFYREVNGFIYKALVQLSKKGQPVDLLTVPNELRSMNVLEDVGGEVAIIGLLNLVPTSVHAHEYARIVTEKYIRRSMIMAARLTAKAAYDESKTLDDAIAEAQTALDTATRAGTTVPTTILDAASEMIDFVTDVDNAPERIYTGFRDLDTLTGGLRSTQLIYVASRPGMGKTSLMSCLAVNAAKAGKRSMIFSLEMRPTDLVVRMAAADIKLNSRGIFDNELGISQRKDVMASMARLSELPISFADSWDASPNSFLSECRRLQARWGLDIAFIDYLQLMKCDEKAENTNARVSNISRNLKLASEALDIPIVVNSQLSRAVEQRKDKRPQLSDLRDSGSIEQDADMVIFIYRPGYYDYTVEVPLANINVAKHRNGPTGEVDLLWQGEYTGFYDLKRTDIDMDKIYLG
jgi:replicative DNA helicase